MNGWLIHGRLALFHDVRPCPWLFWCLKTYPNHEQTRQDIHHWIPPEHTSNVRCGFTETSNSTFCRRSIVKQKQKQNQKQTRKKVNASLKEFKLVKITNYQSHLDFSTISENLDEVELRHLRLRVIPFGKEPENLIFRCRHTLARRL